MKSVLEDEEDGGADTNPMLWDGWEIAQSRTAMAMSTLTVMALMTAT